MPSITAISVGGKEAPSTRFRLLELLPFLEKAGYTCTVHYPRRRDSAMQSVSITGEWLRIVREAQRADIVLVQKRVIRRTMTRAIAATRTPVVFDLDDALFVSPQGLPIPRGPLRRLTELVSASQLCIAGNEYLASWARGYCRNIAVVPTGLDTEVWHPKVRRAHHGVVIGWAGTAGNLAHLESIAPAMAAIQRVEPSVRFVVVCDRKPQLESAAFEFRPWSLEREVDDLADMDVGLMPLSDNAWTRGKCGFKAIQFMALGNPVIASPVGVNRHLVDNRVNGLTATGVSEWYKALEYVVRNGPAREQMGRAARDSIVQSYDLRLILKQFTASVARVLA